MPVYKDLERNSWFVQINYTNSLGEHKSIKKRGFKTKKEASSFEDLIKNKINSPESMTLSEFYAIYISDVKHKLKISTLLTLKSCFSLHILPLIGNKQIKEISPEVISYLQNSLINSGLSDSYISTIHRHLSALFSHGMRYYNFSINPAQRAGLSLKPKSHTYSICTVDDMSKILSYLNNKDPKISLALKLLFFCGIRLGELLALTPSDVFPERNSISINKTYTIKKTISSPKSDCSNREVIVPKNIFSQLMCYIQTNCKENTIRIFHTIYTNQLNKALNQATDFWNLPHLRIHDLRHSHASLLIRLGFSSFIVKNRLGHNSIQITLSTYSHLLKEEEYDLSNQLQLIESSNLQYSYPIVADKNGSHYNLYIPDFIDIPAFYVHNLAEAKSLADKKIMKQISLLFGMHQPLPRPTAVHLIPQDKNRIIFMSESFSVTPSDNDLLKKLSNI